MSVCLECGGDGIGQHVSPRAASIAHGVFHLRSVGGKLDWRGNVKNHLERSAMSTAGPLMAVLRDAGQHLAVGWTLEQGDLPDRSYACEHCGGEGQCEYRCCRRLPPPERFPRGAPPRTFS